MGTVAKTSQVGSIVAVLTLTVLATAVSRHTVIGPRADLAPSASTGSRADLPINGETPPLVAYARESLATLDEVDRLNAFLQPSGGVMREVEVTGKRWLGNSRISRLDLLTANAMAAARRNDDPFYRQMAEGTADALYVPAAQTRGFTIAARRAAYDIIDRYEFRERWRVAHTDMLGADAAYLAPRHPPSGSSADGWTIVETE